MRPETMAFVAALSAGKGLRVTLDHCWEALYEVRPDIRFSPDERRILRTIINDAEAEGLLSQARTRIDTSEKPPLPHFVTLVRPRDREPRADPVWSLDFAWADELTLTSNEVSFLTKVREFLRDLDPDEPVVPMQERSLQIAGDEKALSRLVRSSQLFEPGRLSPEALRCEDVRPPFLYKQLSDTPVLLVAENSATYASLCRALTCEDGIGFVGYGAGMQFTASVTYALDLRPVPAKICYYGDIDAKGLFIPAKASLRAQEIGLPQVEPAGDLYRELFRVGQRLPGQTGRGSKIADLVSWLPEDLRQEASGILASGRRLAQESVGYRELRHREFRQKVLRSGSLKE